MKGSALQSALIEALYYDGYLVIRVNQGGARFENEKTGKERFVWFGHWSMLGYDWQRRDGVSDLLAFRPGVNLAIEVKGDGDTIREGQNKFLEAAREAGFVPIVAEKLDDIGEYLARIEVQ